LFLSSLTLNFQVTRSQRDHRPDAMRSPAPGNDVKAWQLVFRTCQGGLCHWAAGGRDGLVTTLVGARCVMHSFLNWYCVREKAFQPISGQAADVTSRLGSLIRKILAIVSRAFCGEPSRVPESPRTAKISPPLLQPYPTITRSPLTDFSPGAAVAGHPVSTRGRR
jgi:hypothetical protein